MYTLQLVYVLSDNENKDNEGKFVVFRMPKGIKSLVETNLKNGNMVLHSLDDLKKGKSLLALKIVKKKGVKDDRGNEFPDYTSSLFINKELPSDIVLENVPLLEDFFEFSIDTYKELEEIVNNKSTPTQATDLEEDLNKEAVVENDVDADDIPF